jgi:hypothetical protein
MRDAVARPRRLRSRVSDPTSAKARNPSHFGSNDHASPEGSGPDLAGIGSGDVIARDSQVRVCGKVTQEGDRQRLDSSSRVR